MCVIYIYYITFFGLTIEPSSDVKIVYEQVMLLLLNAVEIEINK